MFVCLNWDCLCHSAMSLSLSHKTTSYLPRSQSINITVNRSQHASFKHWSNGFLRCGFPRKCTLFLSYPIWAVGVIHLSIKLELSMWTGKKRKWAIDILWCDVVWQNKYRRYATREHYNKATAEERGRIWFRFNITVTRLCLFFALAWVSLDALSPTHKAWANQHAAWNSCCSIKVPGVIYHKNRVRTGRRMPISFWSVLNPYTHKPVYASLAM